MKSPRERSRAGSSNVRLMKYLLDVDIWVKEKITANEKKKIKVVNSTEKLMKCEK